MARRNSWPSTYTVSKAPSASFTLRGMRSARSAGRLSWNSRRGSTRWESPELDQILFSLMLVDLYLYLVETGLDVTTKSPSPRATVHYDNRIVKVLSRSMASRLLVMKMEFRYYAARRRRAQAPAPGFAGLRL